MATEIEREFAGETRRFELRGPDPVRLYRGIEGEGLGNIWELAQRASAKALGRGHVEQILAHGLSRGHATTLLDARLLVRDEMRGKPLASFLPLALEVLAAATYEAEEA
jgi:hypothetical protein